MAMATARPRTSRLAAATVVAVAAALAPRAASAQLHWDASLGAGVNKRFLTGGPAAAGDAGFGPAAQLTAHVALLPLVRVGGYLGYDVSPLDGDAAARGLAWGGLRAKIMSPWPRGALRAWLFFGFGYASTYARSYRTTLLVSPSPGAPVSPQAALVHGSSGGLFEVPFGLGASYKLRKPWEIFAELGMRAGFGTTGSAYEEGPRVSIPGLPEGTVPARGDDRFSLGLSLGVLVDL